MLWFGGCFILLAGIMKWFSYSAGPHEARSVPILLMIGASFVVWGLAAKLKELMEVMKKGAGAKEK